MSQLYIDHSEEKQSPTGRIYKQARINGQQVSVWPDFSQYQQVMTGSTVEGVIQQKGKYSNLVDGNLGKPTFSRQPSGAVKAAETTARSVREAQQSKNESIKVAATMRDATLILTSFYPQDLVPAEGKEQWIQERWEYWQKWLNQKWEELTNDPGF